MYIIIMILSIQSNGIVSQFWLGIDSSLTVRSKAPIYYCTVQNFDKQNFDELIVGFQGEEIKVLLTNYQSNSSIFLQSKFVLYGT